MLKRFLKKLFLVISYIITSPVSLIFLFSKPVDKNLRFFKFSSQLLAILPGLFGEYLRLAFYKISLQKCADTVSIGFGTIFSQVDVIIEENVSIGAYCVIGKCQLGKNTILGSRVSIISGLHQHGHSDKNSPMRLQPGIFTKVLIGEDCWLGESSVVANNIGAHSIVATGSIVTKSFSEFSIIAGNPALLIKSRE